MQVYTEHCYLEGEGDTVVNKIENKIEPLPLWSVRDSGRGQTREKYLRRTDYQLVRGVLETPK